MTLPRFNPAPAPTPGTWKLLPGRAMTLRPT